MTVKTDCRIKKKMDCKNQKGIASKNNLIHFRKSSSITY